MILEDFGAEKCVCIDKVQPYQAEMWCKHYKSMKHYDKYGVTLAQAFEEQDYFMYEMYGEDITEDFFAQFDVCVSLACFEHVKPLTTVLKNICSSLKKGGVLLTEFGPIWSCAVGSHWRYKWNECDFNVPGLISPFAHLRLSIEQIGDLLRKQFPLDSDENIMRGAYDIKTEHGYYVNQLFFEDYEGFFKSSDFSSYEICSPWEYNVGNEYFEELKEKIPYKRFDVYNMFILAVK
ncbi:hypothetical protein AGMMS49593_04560 [Endomicrobiia bacterium]|nr:hypothetical protein AGMMS49593_04560 [Endomicrobiia bacterium]